MSLKPETQAALDKFNKAYFPHAKERKNRIVSATPAVDPLLAASQADVARQCDELRALVREAIPTMVAARMITGGEPMRRIEDWLRRARAAAK